MAADAPTPADLARALALIDRCEPEPLSLERVVFAVARASIAYDHADLDADDMPIDFDDPAEFEAAFAPIEARRNSALDAYNAALAALCARASGGEA